MRFIRTLVGTLEELAQDLTTDPVSAL
jgi:hypothetical protein